MSKVMLIMDMPESCVECEYHGIRLDGTIRCIVCKAHMGEGAPKSGRADWCPLREVPEKKSDRRCQDEYYINGYKDGYNACIDEVLGN